eukprot:CAMPEP_0174352258 /NCGR_PEP_ID=MMETSP0811_2-20130205/9878_1 /TAXON_ID=73025 ORGANISM="Eutreptiella gymnastica-like, Strain CCMP1594" /NCGR_SAMPLE_ID=MMETSP0811_2 /ASSEMBLY_ACC=CAM_ASM_000667 /LENGTH=156 /DNA_ID=CAMNT_0015482293 /DNA_START=83 /DNA_END=552 /DNA_ORIENTATION=-
MVMGGEWAQKGARHMTQPLFPSINQLTTMSRYLSDQKTMGQKKPGKRRDGGPVLRRSLACMALPAPLPSQNVDHNIGSVQLQSHNSLMARIPRCRMAISQGWLSERRQNWAHRWGRATAILAARCSETFGDTQRMGQDVHLAHGPNSAPEVLQTLY